MRINNRNGQVQPRAPRRAGALMGAALVAVGLTSAVGTARADDWTSLGLDAARSRTTLERSGPAFRAREWRFTLPPVAEAINRVLVSTPAVADGFVVFGTTSGEIVAVGASDGQLRWRFRARDGLHASPAIVRGKVVIPSFDGNLYAVRLADGQPLWTRNLGSVVFSSPVPVGDSVVLATGFPARKVVRLDAATGEPQWETEADVMDQASNSSVAVAGDQVIVGAMAGTYYSFALDSGHLRWTYSAPGAVHLAAPVIVGERAYFAPGGTSHAVHAVDLSTGKAPTGWPLDIPELAADPAAGTVKGRDYAVSSLVAVGDRVIFQQRFLELIDSDNDFALDTYVMREETIAVSTAGPAIAWRVSNGQVSTRDRSAIPAFGTCPTPLVYADASARTYLATMSTLTPRLRVLDASSGIEAWSKTMSAPTRSSPVLANGRLVIATDAGVVHGLLSSANQPPFFTPRAASQPATVPAAGAVITWARAVDPEGGTPRYTVRVDRDGEVLTGWEHELTFTSGEVSARLPWVLEDGVTYTYAVRARDAQGAWSEWSPPQTVKAVRTPDVTVGGVPVSSLDDALAMAHPGDVVRLGAGTLRLASTLSVPPGVSLAGGGAHQTVVDATGLDRAVTVRGSRAGAPTSVEGLSIKGGRVGVAVADSDDAVIRNVVVRDVTDAGILVEAGASTQVINATVVRTGTAVRAAGHAQVRNSLIVNNRTGLVAAAGGTLTSNYNDVNGNRVGYDAVTPGAEDLDRAVAFVDAAADDFRLRAAQPTTDRGAPGDSWEREPAPNGGRVNLGAFGNTAEAESSAPAQEPTGPSGTPGSVLTPARPNGPAPVADGVTPPDGRATTPRGITPSGGGCGVASATAQPTGGAAAAMAVALLAAVAVAWARRRVVRAPSRRFGYRAR